MSILFDVLLVAVFLLCVWIGKVRGLFRSLFGLLCGVLAAVLAFVAAGYVAEWFYGAFVRDQLAARLSEAVVTGDAAGNAQALWDGLPNALRVFLEKDGISSLTIVQTGESVVDSVLQVIEPAALQLLEVLFALLLFVILLPVLRLLARAADGVFKLPVLHGLNSGLGMVFGVLTGLLFVYLLCVWSEPVFALFPETTADFLQTCLENSYIRPLFL